MFVGLRVCVCVFVNAINLEPFEILSRNVLREQDIFKSSDGLENGCIPMHYGALVLI